MPLARILLIENTRAKSISSFAPLLKKRHDVLLVSSGKQALQAASSFHPDIIVLDARATRTPGGRICQTLRAELPHIPMIHLYPEGKLPTNGENYADVVLLLPYTIRKLNNTIERLLKKQNPDELPVICGPFTVFPERRILTFGDEEHQMTPKLSLLVETFARNPSQIIDRKTLMERVWQTDYMGDTRTLDVHIRWFRQIIESDPSHPQFLKTVRGIGYRLDIVEPEVVPALTDQPVLAF